MTLTEQIYDELMNGLDRVVDWEQFLSRYRTSKGPLYNAIGRVLQDVTAQVTALGEERRKAQEELNQGGLRLDSLNQKIKEAESAIEAKTHELSEADEERGSLEKQIESLKSKLDEKNEFINQVGEIEKLGFNIDRLRQLKDALTEIGAKHGLKGKEAVGKFFYDLGDYDAKTGFEVKIQRLETITETKKLEAEKWQAEAEKIEREFKQLTEAIDAIQALLKRGIKPEQIVSWRNSLTSSGGVEELEEALKRYGSIEKLLAAKKRQGKRLDTKVAELNGKLDTLKEQKAKIEGTIKVLKTSALNEMKEVSQTGVEEIGKVAQAGNNSLRQTGKTDLSELKEALSLVDNVAAKALEAGKIIGQLEHELDKSKETKEKTEALVAAIERGK